MNLFVDAIARWSSLGLDALNQRVGPYMPEHFLASTRQLEPALGPHAREVDEILAAFTARRGESSLWRNPEIYAQIALLAEAARRHDDLTPRLASLRVHAGLVPLRSATIGDGTYRLMHVDGSIGIVSAGTIEDIGPRIVTTCDAYRGLILRPHPGLFADLIAPALYPTVADADNARDATDVDSDNDNHDGADRIVGALRRLARDCPDVFADFEDVVSTVVLVPDLHDQARWSYNLRLSYFGGIFLNAYATTGVQGLVEGLIHEYYHQRLWQWWAYEQPDGLPPEEATLRSPVTGRVKSVRVMIHALLIYVAIYDYYLSQRGGDEDAWVSARLDLLRTAIPELHRSLSAWIGSGTILRAMVDDAAERFAVAAGTQAVA